MELTDVGTRIADGEEIDWSSRDLTPTNAGTAAILQQLQVLERIAAHHAASLPPATIGRFPSLDLNRPSHPADDIAPVRWGRLDVIRKVGRGTFGDVYLAHDRSLDRPVALKLLRHQEGADRPAPDVIEEGRLLARVRHPNVVAVYGAERIDARVGVWTEFVDGVTLAEELQSRGPFPPEEVAAIGHDLCRALDVVHHAGLLHRDIKAQNVMRDSSGRVLLTDFGASRLVSENDAAPGELAGTPIYLAPEVLAGGAATRASDLYSLGVLLHHLATRSYPVTGRSIRDLRDAHVLGRRTSVASAGVALPAVLVSAIDAATEPDPSRRISSASAFAETLARARPDATAPRSRLVWMTAIVGTALIGASVGVASLLTRGTSIADPVGNTVSTQQFWPAWQASASADQISPDGEWVLCTIRLDGQLARCPLDGSMPIPVGKILTRPSPVLSPDGLRVAYIRRVPGTSPKNPGTTELHVASTADGSRDQLVLTRGPAEGIPSLIGWSDDTIAFRLARVAVEGPPTTDQIMLISAATLKPVVTRSLPAGTVFPRISPDGRAIVFSGRISGQGGIWKMDVASGELKSISTGASRHEHPFWSATGSNVLFTSNRGGTFGLWRVAATDGNPDGPPELVRELGRSIAWPYGFARDGRLFLGLEPVGFDSYVAEIDPSAATVISQPSRIARDPLDANATPDWSSRGQLAFISAHGGPNSARSIVTVQDETGQVQFQFPISASYYQTRLRWLSDGRTALIGLFRYDMTAGKQLDKIVLEHPHDGFVDVTPSGRLVYKTGLDIREHDLTSGRERVLLQAAAGAEQHIPHFSLAPDGRQLAIVRRHADDGFSLDLVEDGTALRTIVTAKHEMVLGPWTPDARYLVFGRMLDLTDDRSEIAILDVTTGTVRSLPIVMKQIWQLRLHPDGRKLAFVSGASSQEMALMWGAPLR